MKAWVNGRLLDAADAAAVPVIDRGYALGCGIFETLEVVNGRPFALVRHLQRLTDGAKRVGLRAADTELVRQAIEELTAAERLAHGRLRITWTGTTLAVTLTEFTAYPPTVALVTCPWPRNEHSPLVGVKATGQAENVLALEDAAARGAGEALLLNIAGNVSEGSVSNVFFVLDDELCTPTLQSGCLPGITRALVLEWYGAREVDVPAHELERASEIFVTSSLRGVQPVHALDGRRLPAPGPVTGEVAQLYKRRKNLDLDP